MSVTANFSGFARSLQVLSRPRHNQRCLYQDAAEDAPEAAKNCSLHRAGQLPALAGAVAAKDPAVHVRAGPPVPQRKPLHHRRLQGSPALQALPEKVGTMSEFPHNS